MASKALNTENSVLACDTVIVGGGPAVESGWRASFYLDSPLGREPSYGQYFVMTVEARLASGDVERRSLPLVATNPRASGQR